jgi:hypothetical protein
MVIDMPMGPSKRLPASVPRFSEQRERWQPNEFANGGTVGMNWLRLYDTTLDDPKVQQLTPAMFRNWINLLCLASQSEPRGTLPDVGSIAFRLRMSESSAKQTIKSLVTNGLLDETGEGRYEPHNWTGRQRVTDDVAQRVRKHRSGVTSNGSVTLQNALPVTLHETPLKRSRATDTETDTETENTLASVPPAPALEPKLQPVHPQANHLPKSRMPDDWEPNELTKLTAHNAGLSSEQTDIALNRFRHYARANGKLYADWQSAAQMWLSSESKFQQPEPTRVAASGNGNRPIPIRDNVMRQGDPPDDDPF